MFCILFVSHFLVLYAFFSFSCDHKSFVEVFLLFLFLFLLCARFVLFVYDRDIRGLIVFKVDLVLNFRFDH